MIVSRGRVPVSTVGYWFVESLGRDRSRVYYSAIATVPSWVPRFAVPSILDLAAKRSTGWVDIESRKAYAERQHPNSLGQRIGRAFTAIGRAHG